MAWHCWGWRGQPGWGWLDQAEAALSRFPLSSLSLCPQSAALDLRSKEEKDAELGKRIEALRKKNEALIKRYQVRGTRPRVPPCPPHLRRGREGAYSP